MISITHVSSTTSSLLSSEPSTKLFPGTFEPTTITTPDLSIPVIPPTTNSHLMVTQAKVRTHKQKVYNA